MTIDCTLSSLIIPGFPEMVPEFGTKKADGVSSTAREAAGNAMLPFGRQRPFPVTEDSGTSEIQAHTSFVIQTGGITLALGEGGFAGCEVRVFNLSGGEAVVVYGAGDNFTTALDDDEDVKFVWTGAAWKLIIPVEAPDGFGQYQEGRNLLEVLGVDTPADAMYVLCGRLNNGVSAANGEPDFSGLQIGDYIDGIDLSAIPAENGGTAGQAWNDTYKNNRIVISGFNTYKHTGDAEVTKNHLLFTFRNIPLRKRMNPADTCIGGYAASEMRAFLEGVNGDGTGDYAGSTTVTTAAFLNALKAQIGGEYILPVRRVLSTRPAEDRGWNWLTCSLFLPSEHEIFGVSAWGDPAYDDGLKVQFPIYQKAAGYRCKRYNGVRDWYSECSPHAFSAAYFADVSGGGGASYGAASAVGGCAPAFCAA
jgi:hypothetical protein